MDYVARVLSTNKRLIELQTYTEGTCSSQHP